MDDGADERRAGGRGPGARNSRRNKPLMTTWSPARTPDDRVVGANHISAVWWRHSASQSTGGAVLPVPMLKTRYLRILLLERP
jgi:hypothetical protein